MTDTTDVVRLDDLANPTFTAEAQQFRDMMTMMAADCPLDAAALHAKASADTGLDDFGPIDYRERLDVLLGALRDIDGLNGPGVVNFYGQLLQLLKNRLLLTDLLKRHPEIHDIELLPPVAIVGLPVPGQRICTICWPPPGPSGPCRTGSRWSRSRWRPRPVSSPTRGGPGWMSRST